MKNKILLTNILSLSTLQLVNYAIPLITTPYIVRIIGIEKFGLIAFATATIGYFQLLVDYGFNLTATQAISVNQKNREKIEEIFGSVLLVKLKFFIVSIFFLSVLLSIDKFQVNWEVYTITFLGIFGQVVFPIWLLQGLEKLKIVTIINISVRLISTLGLFLLVKSKDDFLIVPILTSLSSIVSGITGLIVVTSIMGIKFKFQPFSKQKIYLKEGWHIFSSTIMTNLYTTSTLFILGIFTNDLSVGLYSGAEKILRVFKGLYGSVSQSLFPHVANKLDKNFSSGINYLKKIGIKIVLTNLFVSVLIFIFSPTIVSFILGDEFIKSVLLLRIMSFLPFVTSISNILGIQLMINIGLKKQFNLILFSCAIFSLIANILFIPSTKELGATIILLVTEIFVSFLMYLYLKKIIKRSFK